MTALIPFLFIFGFILTVLLLNGLSWFHNKELQERRELDLQILALDHGATFNKTDIRLVNRLSQFDRQLSYSFLNQIKTYNVISKSYEHYLSHFFEIASPTKDKSNQPVLQNGIVVEFNDELPYRFDIGRKEIWDWMNRDSHPRIESYLNPSWLPTQFSV